MASLLPEEPYQHHRKVVLCDRVANGSENLAVCQTGRGQQSCQQTGAEQCPTVHFSIDR